MLITKWNVGVMSVLCLMAWRDLDLLLSRIWGLWKYSSLWPISNGDWVWCFGSDKIVQAFPGLNLQPHARGARYILLTCSLKPKINSNLVTNWTFQTTFNKLLFIISWSQKIFPLIAWTWWIQIVYWKWRNKVCKTFFWNVLLRKTLDRSATRALHLCK